MKIKNPLIVEHEAFFFYCFADRILHFNEDRSTFLERHQFAIRTIRLLGELTLSVSDALHTSNSKSKISVIIEFLWPNCTYVCATGL